MTSMRDVFVIAASSAANPADALRQTIKESGVNPARVQDFICAADSSALMLDLDELARAILMVNCSTVMVSSSMRALIFASQSILCEDADLILVCGNRDGQAAALLLASPASVGIHNLTPLARIEAHSLTSVAQVLKKAELTIEDVSVKLEGTCGALTAIQVIEHLNEQKALWGIAQVGKAAILIERI